MTKTTTKTKTQTKCLKHPTDAILLKCCQLTHSNYDDRYLTLVILFTPVTLVTLFRSYNQFYRAECITISGFFVSQRQKENKMKRNIQFHANLKNLDSGGIESLKFYTDVSKAQVI